MRTDLPVARRVVRGQRRTWRRAAATAAAVARVPEVWGGVVLVGFLIISAVWLSVDTRVPVADSGRHLNIAFNLAEAVKSGGFNALLETFDIVPPGAHLPGILYSIVAGPSVEGSILAQNLVFAPLLAVGCYGAGRVAYGRVVGVLAVIFAFAVPMVITQFHLFMVDPPLTATAAVSVWLLLASRRFESLGISIAAGVAVGFGMFVKPTFAFFWVGVALVMLVRGGWRHWYNVVVFALFAVAIAGPWYAANLADLASFTNGAATNSASVGDPTLPQTPDRWTVDNWMWYGWSMVNISFYAPLCLFAGVGFVWAVVGYARSRSKSDLAPELVVGLVVAWIGTTWISLNDHRYILPALVFTAVLGTFWILRLRPALRDVVLLLFVATFIVNTVAANTDIFDGRAARIPLPPFERKEEIVSTGAITPLSNAGYVVAGPNAVGRVPALLEAASEDGMRVVWAAGYGFPHFDGVGVIVLARESGMEFAPSPKLGRDALALWRVVAPPPEFPTPCSVLPDGSAVYAFRGPMKNAERIGERMAKGKLEPYCPLD